ncbi:MAG: ABC-2 family transporter protein [Clostridia bacterium]|nr:ABC-2 family transporter protein [Clostridia bacterium]
MKTMLEKWRPYLTVFRLRALQETQYRAAALGGLVTQVFFGLVYIFLYTALYAGSDPQALRDTITYVWIQQMFFRMMFSNDGELTNLIMSGGVAYMLVRPIDQHRFWVCREVGGRLVGAGMRMLPMLLVQLLLPAELRISLPDGPVALLQFVLSVGLGVLCLCELTSIIDAINMKTLDRRGISAILNLTMLTFSGNVIPLTLFPDGLQALVRYQPFAQALDASIRMYQHAAALPEWALNVGVQIAWIFILRAIGRAMWARQLNNMIVQGG